MSTDGCEGYEEVLRVLNEVGYDGYVHSHVYHDDVDVVAKEINDAGHACVPSKSMFFKSKKGELVMVSALRTTKTDIKRIHSETGTRGLHFASADVLMENLHVVDGCVTPLALVNNVEKKNVRIIIDKNLVESTTAFVMRPCRNDRSVVLKFPELKAFLDKLGYAYKVVDFDAEPPAEEVVASPNTKKAPKEKKPKDAPEADAPEDGSA